MLKLWWNKRIVEWGMCMKKVIIKKKETFEICDKFYIIKKGKVLLKNIFPNGKIVTNEHWLKSGDLIGQFINHFTLKKIDLPVIEMEVKALEDTVLEEIQLDIKKLKSDSSLNSVLSNFIKLHVFQLLFHFYDTKGYILTVLKLYSDKNSIVSKDDFSVEHLNISKSQFYNVYGQLRKLGYFKEEKRKIYLNLEKANEYLGQFF